jgi:hypothetical protein
MADLFKMVEILSFFQEQFNKENEKFKKMKMTTFKMQKQMKLKNFNFLTSLHYFKYF